MKLSDIPARLRLMGKKQADLARALDNLDTSTLSKLIAGKGRKVQLHEIPKIEAFFGEKLELDELATAAPFTPRRQVQRRIPVYGYAAAGGQDRIAYADDRVLEWREPPPLWNGSGFLAYVRLGGTSMEPRYFAGELAPVMLGVEPARGQDCLIEFTNSTAAIKTYLGKRPHTLLAHQYNPDQDLDFPLSDVHAVHAIWRPGLI
ncbi:MAG TPA: helix-turn-helix transcriptional regulator [Caulobacteraceae bacterium]|nr:helix-turn-helix transcriptional regulator [Caulobacteraceae bacterium]